MIAADTGMGIAAIANIAVDIAGTVTATTTLPTYLSFSFDNKIRPPSERVAAVFGFSKCKPSTSGTLIA